MSERIVSIPQIPQKPSINNAGGGTSCCPLLFQTGSTLNQSLSLLLHNKFLFFSIFALLTLPLSLILFSLSLSSHPIVSHVLRLESLAALSTTRFEARHVWKESRDSALSLFRLKLLCFVPSYILSFLAAVTTVSAAHSICHAKPTSLRTAFAAIKPTWTRLLTTSICIYAILLSYSAVPRVLSAIIGGSGTLRLGIWVFGSAVEVYLVAVLGMGLVVSITEKRFGWDAIRVGWGLMEGRQACGCVLSGLLALATGGIGWRMEGLTTMDGEDEAWELKWTGALAVMGWEGLGLTALYGWVVVWGYVVNTVFYCECRKRHLHREEGDQEGVVLS